LINVGPLEESRLPMLWGEEPDAGLLAFYKELIALRRQTQAIWRRPRQTFLVDDEKGLYVYSCRPYMVFLNNGPQETAVSLDQGRGARLVLATDPAVLLDSRSGRITLPPYAGAVCLMSRI
jgi:glycosidase